VPLSRSIVRANLTASLESFSATLSAPMRHDIRSIHLASILLALNNAAFYSKIRETLPTSAIGPERVKTLSRRELAKPVLPQVATFRLRRSEREITVEVLRRRGTSQQASRPHRCHQRFGTE